MSNWTHVAGIIRLDAFRLSQTNLPNFVELFGRELHFNSPESEWVNAQDHPEQYLPCGSEGSLSLVVWENPNPGDLDAYTISIFGDLRDHQAPDEIVEWFKSKVYNNALMVRNACVTVHNEWYGMRNWAFNPDEEKEE